MYRLARTKLRQPTKIYVDLTPSQLQDLTYSQHIFDNTYANLKYWKIMSPSPLNPLYRVTVIVNDVNSRLNTFYRVTVIVNNVNSR